MILILVTVLMIVLALTYVGILLIRNVRISDVLHFRTSHTTMALQVICLWITWIMLMIIVWLCLPQTNQQEWKLHFLMRGQNCGNIFWKVCCSIRNLKPNLSTNEVTSQCNNGDIDLKQYLLGQIPAGSILVWSTDNNSSDGVSPVISGPVSSSGTYYGYFMNIEGNCFSNPSNAIVDYNLSLFAL